MLKKVRSLLFLTIGASANPFVGEHKDADMVQMENGGTSHRVHPVNSEGLNKYESLINKSVMSMRKSAEQTTWEYFFGVSQDELDLQEILTEEKLNTNTKKYTRGRLGSKVSSDLRKVDSDSGVYLMKIYMNDINLVLMNLLLDPATEEIIVEGSECDTCGLELYDIQAAINDPNLIG